MARTSAVHLERYANELPGEDRSYGGNSFYVDLVPRTAWFANLRAMMPPSHWRALSQYVIARAGRQCEICSSSERLEAHERWDFDETTHKQKLARIVCVCKMCHLSIHTGIAEILGIRADVESHIFLLTMWGKREMKRHMKEAGKKWERLSLIWWDIDVTVVSRAGLTLYSKEELWQRVNDKRRTATEHSESRCLVIDGYACDYSEQLTDGFVVFIPDADEQTLDGLPVSGGIGVDYWCKDPALIDPEKSRMALKTYMQAYRRPYGIGSNEALTEALKDRSQPRRLVMTENVDVTREMLDEGLRDGIIFSWAS